MLPTGLITRPDRRLGRALTVAKIAAVVVVAVVAVLVVARVLRRRA